MSAASASLGDPPIRPVRVLIVTAIREELGALLARGLPPGVVAASTGDGPRKAAAGAAALCERHHPQMLFGAGMAGALSTDLSAGDLVVANRVLDAEGEAPSPDAALLARGVGRSGARAGTLFSVDRPVVTTAAKAAWAAKIGSPAVVDMESAAWARAAGAFGIPYLIVRAVSDTADEALPGYLSECMDEQGGIRRVSVAARALAHPASIPALWRMRRRVAGCGGRLADFAARLFSEGL